MTSEERAIVLCWWTSLCAFAASWYLAGSLWKAIAVAGFVLGSMFLSFGARWLARLTFAASVVALAVLLGFPHPSQWGEIIQHASEAVARLRTVALQ